VSDVQQRPLKYGDVVEIPWVVGTVRARVLEVHGYPGNERVLLEVLDVDDEASEPLTVTYPIRDVHRLTAA
jgi:hypothetical protein